MINGTPDICICLPVFNGGKNIAETLNSLVLQDYPDFEIVVCDNLSTDGTKQIVEEFISNNPLRIRYMLNPLKGTAEQNWNFLLRNLVTEANYIALYHADDIYDSSILSKQYRLIKEEGVGAVFTLSTIINEKGEDITKGFKHQINLPRELGEKFTFDYNSALQAVARYRNFIRTPSFFFRKDILPNYGVFFDTSFYSSADLDFWLRIAAKDRIAIVREPLLAYRIGQSQGSFKIMQGREEPSDFFKVIGHHLGLLNDPGLTQWFKAYRSMELIICAVNLSKNEKKVKALATLKEALDIRNIPQLIKISGGIKHYVFGSLLKVALHMNIYKFLIKILDR